MMPVRLQQRQLVRSKAQSASQDAKNIEVPPASFLVAMASAGALLGPILDGFHSRFGVLTYHNPAPFAVEVFNFELCQTAAWVPPMFGLAGIIIGTLYAVLDRFLQSPPESLSPSGAKVLLGIACFVVQYWLSGILLGPTEGLALGGEWLLGGSQVLLWLLALAHWRVFDNTRAGAIVSALTALGGPLIEIGILNFPGWDVYAYALPDFFRIPAWISAVYFCGGPAVGNLARAALRGIQRSNS